MRHEFLDRPARNSSLERTPHPLRRKDMRRIGEKLERGEMAPFSTVSTQFVTTRDGLRVNEGSHFHHSLSYAALMLCTTSKMP